MVLIAIFEKKKELCPGRGFLKKIVNSPSCPEKVENITANFLESYALVTLQ